MTLNKKLLAVAAAMGLAAAAYAATQISVRTPIAVSDGISGDKPTIQRMARDI